MSSPSLLGHSSQRTGNISHRSEQQHSRRGQVSQRDRAQPSQRGGNSKSGAQQSDNKSLLTPLAEGACESDPNALDASASALLAEALGQQAQLTVDTASPAASEEVSTGPLYVPASPPVPSSSSTGAPADASPSPQSHAGSAKKKKKKKGHPGVGATSKRSGNGAGAQAAPTSSNFARALEPTHDAHKELFELFDTDKNGKLDQSEMPFAAYHDTNNNGTIEFEEFVEMMEKKKPPSLYGRT